MELSPQEFKRTKQNKTTQKKKGKKKEKNPKHQNLEFHHQNIHTSKQSQLASEFGALIPQPL